MTTRTYRALLIANSTYPNDAHNLPDLEGPRNDPSLLRDALSDDRYGLFPTDNVRLVVERTMAEVLREAEEFLRTASRQDTLLLYYSGHGMLDLSGELYLCARDTRADRLRSTAVKASDLDAMIQESAAATTVILLDCCHSGAFKGSEMAQALAGHGRFVVTSCRTGELANDAHARNRASMFTHHVVEGLLGSAPDHDGDGLVGLSDLYGYVHARLIAEDRQIPQRSFAGSGDVPMARRSVPAGSEGSVVTEVPDLAASDPVLDVSETLIDLGQVDIDDELPAERVAVVNRGGGELAWSADCAAAWVTVERDEHGLLLYLAPRPGTNRANVHVRDDTTGMVKTVRLVVHAVGRSQPQEAPIRAAEKPATVSLDAAPVLDTGSAVAGSDPPSSGDGRRVGSWFGLAMATAGLGGAWLVVSGLQFRGHIAEFGERPNIFLRHRNFGPGLGTSILGGMVLVVTAAAVPVALAGRGTVPAAWRRFLPGLVAGLAAPLAFERTAISFTWSPAPQFQGWEASFGVVPIVLCLIAAGSSWLALRADAATSERTRWAPTWLLPAGVASAVLWGIGTTIPVYDNAPDSIILAYGNAGASSWIDATNSGQVTTALVLTVVAVIAALVAATYRLDGEVSAGLLAAAAAFLVIVELIELATLIAEPDHRQGIGVLWMLIPAIAFVTTNATALRTLARRRSNSAAAG